MTWFVLVPGMNHGGWWYRPIVEELAAHGHVGDAVTLAGLDPDGPPAPDANLDTHIDDVVRVLDARDGAAVLVGHSYAGSVISGAAELRPEKVQALVYLDAFVPEDGESAWTMTNDEEREWYIDGAGADGLGVAPLPFFDERARPHPLGTLIQKSRLPGRWRTVPRKHYVAAVGAEWLPHTPFAGLTQRLEMDPDFTVHRVDSRHNFLAHGTDLLMGELLPFG
ncbi:alpha/beta fold hydrolase [Nakamurella sp. YIM 132087]|uniref:Alpha/beta fold hydrolase n=1 Tax=Nakamurella alba TaxID=2665158 RepID=A0A7K1FJJ4_9ACTN|nr:alpha/beta fold hydrolase [Nakamurella alba]MTD14240.1 alpha/beta fold hydrolase [Nakamurella alba]